MNENTNIQDIMGKESFLFESEALLRYRIYIPKNYSDDKKYPLALFLHGAGERGDDNSTQLRQVVPMFFKDENSPFYDAIVLCPQCQGGFQWVNTPWERGSYSLDSTPISKYLAAVVRLLDCICEKYSIDESRQYVMGISMGGFGTWDLLMRYPERFAAAIPVCGGADPTKADRLANIPVKTFHDALDPIVPVLGTREIIKAIKDAGGTLASYTETSKFYHGVWDHAFSTEGLFEWLFSNQRKDK